MVLECGSGIRTGRNMGRIRQSVLLSGLLVTGPCLWPATVKAQPEAVEAEVVAAVLLDFVSEATHLFPDRQLVLVRDQHTGFHTRSSILPEGLSSVEGDWSEEMLSYLGALVPGLEVCEARDRVCTPLRDQGWVEVSVSPISFSPGEARLIVKEIWLDHDGRGIGGTQALRLRQAEGGWGIVEREFLGIL